MEIGYAFRALRKSPGTTAVAVLALAFGIGANTAVFSVVNAALLHSAALVNLRRPSSLVMLWERNPQMMAFLAERMPVALENFRQWKRQSRSFEDMTAVSFGNCNIGARGNSAADRPQQVESIRVQPNFFATLGVRPALGRTFTSDEARTLAARVIVVSGGLYRRWFGTKASLAQKTLRIDGVERAIVGVLPEKFQLPAMWEGFDQKKPEVWMPFHSESEKDIWARSYFVYGRLRPGATLAAARSEMQVIGNNLQKQYPDMNKGFGVNVFPLALEDAGAEFRRGIVILQVAVAFVLLIACANVGNLLLARAVAREQEIAVRLALGAPRSRIVRLVLSESLLLALMGGVLGLLPAYGTLRLLGALGPKDIHAFHELRLDPWVLAFTFLVSIATSVVFGLAPALHSCSGNINEALGRSGRTVSGGPRWLRSGMVVGEVALALILLTGAGLMIRSLGYLMSIDPGFKPDHLLTMQTTVVNDRSSAETDSGKKRLFCERLLDSVRQMPGVLSASISSGLPMESVSVGNYNIEGAPRSAEWLMANQTIVSEGFFETMRIPLKRGRTFTRQETEAKEPQTAVVSESFARRHWPKEDPLGKVVLLSNGDKPDHRLAIIGVVGDTRQMGPDNDVKPELYIPARVYGGINMAVRTAGEPAALGPALERAVWSINPQQPIENIRAMDRVLREWPAQRRFYMMVFGGFAGLALLLASLGLYGVLAYVVNLRTRELGVRMAMGAGTAEVLGLVVVQGLKLAGVGIVLGVAGALALTRVMESLIVGVRPSDPLTFASVSVLLAAVALLASYLPARRAAKIDPMHALRAE